MRKLIINNGLLGCAVLVAGILATWAIVGSTPNFALQEFLGWALMVAASLFVVRGIVQAAKLKGSAFTFGKGLKTGLLITLFPALLNGAMDVVYVSYVNPNFSEQYIAYQSEKLIQKHGEEAAAPKIAKMEKEMAMFSSPFAYFMFMATLMLFIGFVAALITSAAVAWQKKRKHESAPAPVDY